MTLQLANLIINRIVSHEIYPKNDDGSNEPPKLNNSLTILKSEGIETLQKRIIDAVGSQSKCFEMEIQKDDEESLFQKICQMLSSHDTNFISLSHDIARELNKSHFSRNIPGGMLVIFDGLIGMDSKKMIGIIKAEIHGGFGKKDKGTNLIIEFLNSLFLTPQQRLYKIAIFVENNEDNGEGLRNKDDFEVFIYDHNISKSDPLSAAGYFYNTFLGCSFASNDKKLTKDFFNYTQEYIYGLNIIEEEKIDYSTALFSYIKLNQSGEINIMDFATEYLEEKHIDTYRNFMTEKGLPDISFHKDITLIRSKLRKRSLRFSSGIRVIAPSEEFDNLFKIIEEKENETIIEIKGKIENEK